MTKQSGENRETGTNNISNGSVTKEDLVENSENLLFSMLHANGIFLCSMLQYNLELSNFINHRIQEDLKTAELLAGCHSFSEVNEECIEFCSRAVDQYTDEAAKLANLGIGLASTTSEEIQQETRKAVLH